MIDSVSRTGNDYYLQIFLEECKCIVKEKKMSKHIIDNTEISDEGNSVEESFGEENSKTTCVVKLFLKYIKN